MLPPDCAPSSIPEDAEEVLQADTLPPGVTSTGQRFICRLNGVDVGVRLRRDDGQLCLEQGLRDGKAYGWHREWDSEGRLEFDGFQIGKAEHGVCRQWYEGRLLGWYVMDHGTGVDLWRDADGSLSEERYYKDGDWHGYERWWGYQSNTTIWWETHYRENVKHGIERQWNAEGRVSRGYPRYWVKGERVTKRQYVSACKRDATLPPYRSEDDSRERQLPPEYFTTQPPAVPPTMPANPAEWRP